MNREKLKDALFYVVVSPLAFLSSLFFIVLGIVLWFLADVMFLVMMVVLAPVIFFSSRFIKR